MRLFVALSCLFIAFAAHAEKTEPKVTFIEYSSLTCQDCAEFHKTILPVIKKEYVETGKIKYEYRDFPTDPLAFNAALAARCEPKLIDAYFATQGRWAISPAFLPELKAIAAESGLKKEKFYACLEDKKAAAAIQDTQAKAQKYQLSALPTYIIGEEKLAKLTSIDDAKKALDLALAGKSPNEAANKEAAEFLKPQSGDYILGPTDAPLTIVEYASLSCPHCAKFHNEILPVLQKDFIDAGKVKLIFRDFPLNKPALQGSMIAHCVAAKQGSAGYYKALKALFGAQEKWAFDKAYPAELKNYATQLGLPAKEVDSCLTNKSMEDRAANSRLQANQQLGIDSTPSFFLDGKKLDHVHSAEEFTTAIRAALPKQ